MIKGGVMKSLMFLPPMLAIFIVTGVPMALASNGKNVVVTNNTSYTLNEFYASSSDSSSWNTSNNLVAGQSIAPGQSKTVSYDDGDDDCTYDLMAVLDGQDQFTYTYQMNTCNGMSAHWTVQ
jgi:hypothetical protein